MGTFPVLIFLSCSAMSKSSAPSSKSCTTRAAPVGSGEEQAESTAVLTASSARSLISCLMIGGFFAPSGGPMVGPALLVDLLEPLESTEGCLLIALEEVVDTSRLGVAAPAGARFAVAFSNSIGAGPVGGNNGRSVVNDEVLTSVCS